MALRNKAAKKHLYRLMVNIAGLAQAVLCFAVLIVSTAEAGPRHAIAMHGEPRYPSGFSHFSYANPDAPVGGTVRNMFSKA